MSTTRASALQSAVRGYRKNRDPAPFHDGSTVTSEGDVCDQADMVIGLSKLEPVLKELRKTTPGLGKLVLWGNRLRLEDHPIA
jgi:hypothetical protein